MPVRTLSSPNAHQLPSSGPGQPGKQHSDASLLRGTELYKDNLGRKQNKCWHSLAFSEIVLKWDAIKNKTKQNKT